MSGYLLARFENRIRKWGKKVVGKGDKYIGYILNPNKRYWGSKWGQVGACYDLPDSKMT